MKLGKRIGVQHWGNPYPYISSLTLGWNSRKDWPKVMAMFEVKDLFSRTLPPQELFRDPW